MELKLGTSLPIQFEKQEDLEDSRFTKVKVWIMHTEKNLNNSFFSKESVESALPSLANIPIVGYITSDNANNKDFNGHEQRMIIDKDGVSIEYLGRVYGIIPETNNAQFEKKTGEDGIEREYLTCEGLLYNKFPESIEIFDRDGTKSQSMELDPTSIEGKFSKEGVYHFTNFKFEAACILGEGVTPAMKGSLIEKFSVTSIKEQFTEMLSEFNQYFSQSSNEVDNKSALQGGSSVNEKQELLEKYENKLEKEVFEDLQSSLDKYSLEELEEKLMSYEVEVDEKQTQEIDSEEEETASTDFSLTSKQFTKELRLQLGQEKYTDDWGWESRKYWYVDHDDNRVYAEDSQDGYRLVGLNYSVNGDNISIDFESKKSVKIVFQDLEEGAETDFSIASSDRLEFETNQAKEIAKSEAKKEFSETESKFDAMQKEIDSLKEFKVSKEKEEKLEVISEFSQLPEEIVKPYIDDIDKYSKEELETLLFAEVGRHNLTFSKSTNDNKNGVITSFNDVYSKPNSNQPAWMELVEQYKSSK